LNDESRHKLDGSAVGTFMSRPIEQGEHLIGWTSPPLGGYQGRGIFVTVVVAPKIGFPLNT
jgi:hypothetical protein